MVALLRGASTCLQGTQQQQPTRDYWRTFDTSLAANARQQHAVRQRLRTLRNCRGWNACHKQAASLLRAGHHHHGYIQCRLPHQQGWVMPMHLCKTRQSSMMLPGNTFIILPCLDDVHVHVQLGLGHEFHDDGLLQCVPNDGRELSCTAIRFTLLAPLACRYPQTSHPS